MSTWRTSEARILTAFVLVGSQQILEIVLIIIYLLRIVKKNYLSVIFLLSYFFIPTGINMGMMLTVACEFGQWSLTKLSSGAFVRYH